MGSCRILTPSDLEYVKTLTEVLEKEGFSKLEHIYDAKVLEGERQRYSLDRNLQNLANPSSDTKYVAHFLGDSLDGVLIGRFNIVPEKQPHFLESQVRWLVAKNKRQGIGQELMSYFIRQAYEQENNFVTLDVHKQNPARQMYQKMGFIDVTSKDDMVQMARYIDEERWGLVRYN